MSGSQIPADALRNELVAQRIAFIRLVDHLAALGGPDRAAFARDLASLATIGIDGRQDEGAARHLIGFAQMIAGTADLSEEIGCPRLRIVVDNG